MLIILEGPDGSGKTTLANEFADELGRSSSDVVKILHSGPPTRHPIDEYLRPLRDYRPGTGTHLILDRWHWGERVYPEVLGRKTELDLPAFRSIEAYLRRLGAIVVHCDLATTAEYVELYGRRGIINSSTHSWQFTHLRKIRSEFARMTYRSALPTWRYQFNNRGFDDFSYILISARHYETSARRLNQFTTYLGPVSSSVLLFGDVRHGVDPATSTDLDPAFLPFRATSGHYLLRAIHSDERSHLQNAGWANACDVDDPAALWKALGEPRVVALGVHASAKLRGLDIPHGRVPHPQYARRFHNGRMTEYGAAIRAAATRSEDLSQWPGSSKVRRDRTPITT